jgi:hypothetical protein
MSYWRPKEKETILSATLSSLQGVSPTSVNLGNQQIGIVLLTYRHDQSLGQSA